MTNDDYIKMCPEINASSMWSEAYLNILWGITSVNGKYVLNTFVQSDANNVNDLCYQTGFWPMVDQGNVKEIVVKDDYTFIHYHYLVHYRNQDYFVVMKNENRVQGKVMIYGNYVEVFARLEKPYLFLWRFV